MGVMRSERYKLATILFRNHVSTIPNLSGSLQSSSWRACRDGCLPLSQLSNSDFYNITRSLSDQNKWWDYFRRIIANGFQCFYCEICSNMPRTKKNNTYKFCAHEGKSTKITIVS